MKKIIIGFTLLTLISISSFASVVKFSNKEGCSVEKEQRKNGVVLYISKGDQQEIVGYGNDYSFGDFVYCAAEKTEINFYEGSQGTGIIISCSEHQNGHEVTRGRVDISLKNGVVTEVKIDGQIKGFFGWDQDSEIECLDLIQE